MKYLISAIAILLAVAVFCWINIICISNIMDRTETLLEGASNSALAGDWEKAERLCAETRDYWRHYKVFLGTVLRHSEADEVSTGLEPLLKCAEIQEIPEFTTRAYELIARVRHMKDMESPTTGNLL